MTEKQFTYIKLGDRDEIQDYIINNNHTAGHFKYKEYHFNNISDFEDLFDLLNELSTENEQLKQQIKELYKFVKYDVDNERDVYPKSILEHLVNILKIIGDVE